MFSDVTIIAIIVGYLAFLCRMACWLEAVEQRRKWIVHPYIYSLSLAVYCTTWTFYGNIGKAATSGWIFVTIFIGPILCLVLGSNLIRKLIRIKNIYHISNLADLIAARYGHSRSIAAVVTIMVCIGIVPYIAVQVKAVVASSAIITNPQTFPTAAHEKYLPIILLGLIALCSIISGARRLDPTERHPGMVLIIVITSIVKLLVFIIAGSFITYGLFDGVADIVGKVAQVPNHRLFATVNASGEPITLWIICIVVSMGAFILLPRQFHIAVIENADETHLQTARWLFPLYLIAMIFFVIPIAGAAVIKGYPLSEAENYLLLLLLRNNAPSLALLVFLGGFSAALGMISLTTITTSTMIVNHLLLPIFEQVAKLNFLRRHLLACRWATIVGIVALGYLFYNGIHRIGTLVNIGLISFAAAFQFAPPMLGLFWTKGNKCGALLGLMSGFGVWFYTLCMPILMAGHPGWLSGIPTWLRPGSLFALALDPLAQGIVCSIAVNTVVYVAGSLYFRSNSEEQRMAKELVYMDSLNHRKSVGSAPRNIALEKKYQIFLHLLNRYFANYTAQTILDNALQKMNLEKNRLISSVELAELQNYLQRILAGVIGNAAAYNAMKNTAIFTTREKSELTSIYAGILSDLRVSPKELKAKMDYYIAREELLQQHASELQQKIAELERQIQLRKTLEEQVQRMRCYLQNIIDSMPSMLVAVNPEGIISEWNFEAEKVTGVPANNAIGKSIANIYPLCASQLPQIKQAIQQCRPQKTERLVQHTQERTFYKDVVVYPLITDGVEGAVIRIDDVTTRVQIEDMIVQTEKMMSVGGLAAGMAHEINNPLGSILLGAENIRRRLSLKLKKNCDIARQCQLDLAAMQMYMQKRNIPSFLEGIQEAGERAAAIVADMLQFCRSGSKNMANVDLVALINKTLELAATDYDLKKTYDFRHIKIIRDFDTSISTVVCIRQQIEQVLLNLLKNAAQVMYEDVDIKQPQIILRTRRKQDKIIIEVEDNGPGMPESIRRRIFEPFFTTKDVGKGTGLGLSVTYFIITNNHNGNIMVESTLGKGTKFTVILPITVC